MVALDLFFVGRLLKLAIFLACSYSMYDIMPASLQSIASKGLNTEDQQNAKRWQSCCFE